MVNNSFMWPVQPDDFHPSVQIQSDDGEKNDWHFLFVADKLICVEVKGMLEPIASEDLRWMDIEVTNKHYLGKYSGRRCFVAEASGDITEGYTVEYLFTLLGRASPPLFYLAGRAKQILDWDKSNQYCGICGAGMSFHAEDRAKVCLDCDQAVYPRISPSIIVLVTDGEKMLLARNSSWQEGFFSTLAGFVEPGESIEQTVHREVEEEVGLKIDQLQYKGSQSWPFPNSLMLGFHACYKSGTIIYNDNEIAEAKWFSIDDLPSMPPGTAISRWLIDEFIASIEGD